MIIKALTRVIGALYHYSNDVVVDGPHSELRGDCSELRGDCSGIRGDCSGIWGDCSELRGDCSELRGDLDDCGISPDDHIKGIHVDQLVKD